MAATDEVYPLFFLDDSELNRLPVHWLLQFDDVLDHQKLHDALLRLLHIGDWRKLGGRLRTKSKGKLEVHVPPAWTTERPAFSYFHEPLSVRKEEHKLAASLGVKTVTPSVQHLSQDLKSFMITPDTPRKYKDWINRDTPLLSIRITTFNNATLVGISWPHNLMDAAGADAMLKSWSLVVAGREDELVPVLGSHSDVLEEVVSKSKSSEKREELGLMQHQLKGCKKIEFLLRAAKRVLINNHPEVRRIFIPAASMAKLRTKIEEEMDQDSEKRGWVSEHSILTAWITHVVASADPSQRPVTQVSSMNARFRFKEVRKDGAYLQNMILPLFTFLPKDIADTTVGHIALLEQRQIDERTTESQSYATLNKVHELATAGKNPILSLLSGDKAARLIAFNNLNKVGPFTAVNFEAAVVRSEGWKLVDERSPAGIPVNFTVHTMAEKLGSFVCIAGKDHAKNVWMIASLQPRHFKKFEEELRKL